MFSWGEDCLRGFGVKGDDNNASATNSTSSDAGVHHLNISYRITDLSAGHNVLAFLKSNGNAFITVTNEGSDGRRVRGKRKFVKCKEKIGAVRCSDDVVTLLSERGSVLCVDTRSPHTPRLVETFSNVPVSQVACGSQHSVALTKDGQVYTWGHNRRGQLGLGKRTSGASSPLQVQSLSATPLVQIAAGGEQSFALSVSGGVFGWGRNDCGQLGLGDTEDRLTPVSVHSLNLKKTCDISCGKDHTAILTKHGAVFTFGSGQHGQLGHNSLENELRPRLVAELWGAKVTTIACGRYHTLVLTDFNKVYSFGCQEQGQLGREEASHPSVPLPVELPQDTSDAKIKTIFAGENCSFATCSSDEEVKWDPNAGSICNITQHCLEGVTDRWISECDSKSWKKIKQEIHRIFSSASCLNKSFLEQRDKHFQTSPKYHGLNLKLARLTFKKLVKKDKVWEEIEAAVFHLLPRLHKDPVGVEGLRIYLLLNELLHVIQKHRRQQNTKLAEAVATAVTNLSAESLQIIGDWWSLLSHSTMGRYVKVWKQAVSVIVSSEPVPRHSGVRNLLQVLQYMYNVNNRVAECRRLPESDFYLFLDDSFLLSDLDLWHFQSQCMFLFAKPLVLCDFPIVLDLQAKIFVFNMNTDSNTAAESLVQFFDFWSWLEWDDPVSHMTLALNLRRASVLEDTFDQLAATHHKNYKKPLMVYFDDYCHPDDVPVYMKDFFYEVFHELVSAESGLFMFNDSETLAWFSSTAPQEEGRRFYLFGVLCGLAMKNQTIIYLPFPLVLFKKLLGVKPSLEDMIEFSPTVGKSLKYTLDDHTDDDMECLDMDFLINWNSCEVDLDPQNPKKRVTNYNKKAFVDAYVNHAFNTSVEAVFQEFKQGFFHVCERDLVRLFRPKELQKVLVGEDFQDWEKLKQNTQYVGEYHAGHPNIQMFWEIFDELTENQKKAFLWFVTGFERLPILNMGKIKMEIRVTNVSDVSCNMFYPQTHTCSSILELPLYSSKEIMQVKLVEALRSNARIRQ